MKGEGFGQIFPAANIRPGKRPVLVYRLRFIPPLKGFAGERGLVDVPGVYGKLQFVGMELMQLPQGKKTERWQHT